MRNNSGDNILASGESDPNITYDSLEELRDAPNAQQDITDKVFLQKLFFEIQIQNLCYIKTK